MKILIAGDFCPIGRTQHFLKNNDYANLFNGFEKIRATVDYAVVNFECPITKSNTKIAKTGPCLKTGDINSLRALKFAGFDLLTLANNHIQDYSNQGVLDTIEYAKKENFETVGAGKNKQAAAVPFIQTIDNEKVGFINIAENEFCAAEDDLAGANTFDFIENTKTITSLRQEVDKVIMIYHGGREHYQLPSPEQRRRLRYFIEIGVDAIVAHHTHCFSGFEYYLGKPIVYSLGNFIFDYKKKYQTGNWTEGMSVILNLTDSNFVVELIPHLQGRSVDSTLKLLEKEDKNKFLEKMEVLNRIIQDDAHFMKEWEKYLLTQENFYFSSLYVKNLYVRALFMKGFLPVSLLKSKHNKLLLNLMRCEAHHEITKGILNK